MDNTKVDSNIIEEKVKATLDELGINFNSLKAKTIQHLKNIEISISNTESEFSELKAKFKDKKLSLSSVSEDVGINSRQTFYNNPELKVYTGYRIEQANELNPLFENQYLKTKIKYLNEQITLMVDRDIDTEILRHDLKKLKETIIAREDSIHTLEEQAREMRNKIRDLEKELRLSKSNSTQEPTSLDSAVVPIKKRLKKN